MIYSFLDNKGTFIVKKPRNYCLYFPLTDKDGALLSSITPSLAGDIKKDNEHFLTLPVSAEDLRSNLLCRRDFFIKTNETTLRLSSAHKNDAVICGMLYQKVKKNISALTIEITNFIPFNLAAEVMWVKVKNKSLQKQKITPTSFIPLYGRSEKNLRDHRHVSSLLNRIELDKYGVVLTPTLVFDEGGHTKNNTAYFAFGYEGEKNPPLGQFPTLDYFYGNGDIVWPDAIEKGIKPVNKKIPEFDGKEACCALRFKDKLLNPGQEVNYFLILGIASSLRQAKTIFGKLNSPEKIYQSLEATQKYWQGYLGDLSFDFKNRDFNGWLLWVRLEPTLRKLFGCSFLPHFDYGKGGRGWRDLWQDALALLQLEPQKAKQLILESFKGVRLDGSNATVITKDYKFIADRNKISRVWADHGVWPYLTLSSYLNRSADLKILLKETVYFRDHLLCRAKTIDKEFSQKDNLLRTKNNTVYKGSILEHLLIQNLVQFFNVGAHNVTKLENADWNDGLDMAPEHGESATFSFMYAHNLKSLCIFLQELQKNTASAYLLKELSLLLDKLYQPINYNDFRQKQKRLARFFEKTKNISGEKTKIKLADLIFDLEEKYKHLGGWLKKKEWLKEGFFNGYYDNRSRRVEGKKNKNMRMMLATQVFAIMSGIATDKQICSIWRAIQKYLKDKKLGGFRLNTNFGAVFTDLGRTFGFSYGDKENGAFFNHMVVMLAYALYKRGFVKEGCAAINSIYKMATAPSAQIYPMIPEYFNSHGQGLYSYLTGSASWFNYTLLEEMLGIKFILGNLLIEPKLVSSNFYNKTITVRLSAQNKIINIQFVKTVTKPFGGRIKELYLEDKKQTQDVKCWLIKKGAIKNITKKEISIFVYLF